MTIKQYYKKYQMQYLLHKAVRRGKPQNPNKVVLFVVVLWFFLIVGMSV